MRHHGPTPAAQRKRLAHWPWQGALAAGLLLAGCARPPTAPQTTTPGQPVLITGGTALVRGPVSSPFFDELKKYVSVVNDDGSQQAGKYDLVIVDGDASAPDALGGDKLIQDAFRAGKWVLGVDLGPEHKRSFKNLIHVITRKPALAMMFRKDPRTDGQTVYRVLEVKAPGPPEADSQSVQPSIGAQASAFARAAVAALGREGVGAQAAAQAAGCASAPAPNAVSNVGTTGDVPQPDQPFPDTLVHFTVLNCDLTQASAPLPKAQVNKNFQQTASLVFNTTFTIALNNENHPLGDYQFVIVQNDTTATPAVNGFANQSRGEQAWFQDQITHNVGPSAGIPGNPPLTWVSNGPSAPNNVTNYTASSTFTVGFQGKDGTAQYTWNNSSSYDIPDWKVSSSFDAGSNRASWNYRSGNPDADKDHTSSPWFYSFSNVDKGLYGTPVPPNSLSLNQNIFHSAITYRTTSLATNEEYFDANGAVRFYDTWCTPVTVLGCSGDGAMGGADPVFVLMGDTYGADLSAVVPDPVKSITFDHNPARPGETVTGTVTLNHPASIDTRVYLSTSSANGNASVQQSMVVVPQGQASATFTVLTNANALGPDPGDQVAVPIVAFNVQGFTQQLTIENPKIAAPTFSPSTVLAGYATVGTVSTGSPVSADTIVTLSSDSSFASVPAQVTISAGKSSATFPVQTPLTSTADLPAGATKQATITATVAKQTASGKLTVTNPVVRGITFNPGTVAGGATSTGTVTLTAPAAVDTVLPLSSDVPPNATVPASVTILQGQASATFQAQTQVNVNGVGPGQSITALISTTSAANNVSGPLIVVNPKIQAVTFNPAPVAAGSATTGTVTMDRAVGADTTIGLQLTAGTSATVPASVTIPAGQVSATFSVPTSAVGDVNPQQITANYAGQTVTGQFSISASTAFKNITLRKLNQDGTLTLYEGVVHLNQDAPVDLPIAFQLSDPAHAKAGRADTPSTISKGSGLLVFVLQTDSAGLPSGDTVVTLTATSPALPGQRVQTQVTISVP